MERYNPLAEGHIERVGRTKYADRPVYVVAEPEHPAAVQYLADFNYVLGKWVLAGDKIVSGYLYQGQEHHRANPADEAGVDPAPAETAAPEPPAPEPEPEPSPAPHDQCDKCGATGDDLKIFDSDAEVYGVVCKCGHMWLSSHPD